MVDSAPHAPLWSLAGRTALVTGAAGGIGGAIARAFAQAGAGLVLSDRSEAVLADLSASLSAQAVPVRLAAGDLSDSGAPARIGAQAGDVDVLVCNAGIEGFVGPLLDAAEADLDRVLQVNLRSAIGLCRACIPGMVARGAGSVVLVASLAGLRGNRAIGAYALTKAALAQLARNLAVEWGPAGVRVNALAPGLIRTGFSGTILNDTERLPRRLALTPLRRTGTPEEVAAAALFLASPAGGFVTGHTLVVDGGTLISDGN